MHDHNDCIGFQLPPQRVHTVLDEGYERDIVCTGPEFGRKPPGDIGVVETNHQHFPAAFIEKGILGKRWRAVFFHGVACQPGDAEAAFQLLAHPVIDGMSGLHVVVAHRADIIAHISRQTRPDVGLGSGHVVVVI